MFCGLEVSAWSRKPASKSTFESSIRSKGGWKDMSQRPRYDSNRVKLRTGEYQKADGHYEYRYTVFGKKVFRLC